MDEEILAWAQANGWTYDRASLYDEEGIEGWLWVGPDGEEYSEMGDWHEPPAIPDRLRALFDPNYKV